MRLRLVGLMIVAEIAAMIGSSAVAATLPELIDAWYLNAAQAGWLGGTYFFGYVAAVPVLVSLTDRIDARIVFAAGCVLGACAGLGFAAWAHDLLSATLWWALAGVSMAGVYMPGLQVIIDRLPPGARQRAVPYYTASFGVGTAVSFLVAGAVAHVAGWHAAFLAGAAGCTAAIACLVLATAGIPRQATRSGGSGAFDLRAVLRNRAALRYVVAYGGHCWELFALRAWIVALLLFAWQNGTAASPGSALTSWSAVVNLAGVPASIVGAEIALRMGRPQLIARVAFAAIALALGIGWIGTTHFLACALGLVLYNIAILGDSGAITTGLVEAADPEARGATLALHSLVGFLGGALGPIAVGVALTLLGGPSSRTGWAAALAVMALGSAVAAAAVVRGRASAAGADAVA